MIVTKRTGFHDSGFRELVRELDKELQIRDGDDYLFYSQFNKMENLKYVVAAYDADEPVGCGAIKEYSEDTGEIKRMFVPLNRRGQGIASAVLKELETWAKELNYKKCILETGKKQPEAIGLYKKNNYKIIPNYGQYQNTHNSICFEKEL